MWSAFLCAREAVRRMSKRHGGAGGVIVNVSSAAARLGSPGEYVDYAASKGALDTMTIGLAKEVGAEGIRVNAVRPGPYTRRSMPAAASRTASIAWPRACRWAGARVEEIAAAVLWLCSDEATYANGAILDVSGGI